MMISVPHNARHAELRQHARIEANFIIFLISQNQERLDAMERTGLATTHLALHRNAPGLAARRALEYPPSGESDACPRCWVRTGTFNGLVIDATSTRTNAALCPVCSFHAVLPR